MDSKADALKVEAGTGRAFKRDDDAVGLLFWLDIAGEAGAGEVGCGVEVGKVKLDWKVDDC